MSVARRLAATLGALAVGAGLIAATGASSPAAATPPSTTVPPPPNPDVGGEIGAEATTGTDPDPLPPPPDCWWEALSATNTDRVDEQRFWDLIDGGDHSEDVIVFLENGMLHRTFESTQKTYRLQIRVCTDPLDSRNGLERWEEVGPPNPTVYWDELTERVTRQVPLPEPDLGVEPGSDGVIDIPVQLGLWIAVTNADDVVARAEPAPGVWAETRASLIRIEFDTGTGTTVSDGCVGAGTPLPEGADEVDEGACGYTYTTVDEVGEHTAVVRAIWSVINTTSAGDTERRPDIVLETSIPIEVFEIQTVGTNN